MTEAEIRRQVEAEIAAWLRAEAQRCDCFAREPNECACGAWDDAKRVDPLQLADAIDAGDYHYPDIPRMKLGPIGKE